MCCLLSLLPSANSIQRHGVHAPSSVGIAHGMACERLLLSKLHVVLFHSGLSALLKFAARMLPRGRSSTRIARDGAHQRGGRPPLLPQQKGSPWTAGSRACARLRGGTRPPCAAPAGHREREREGERERALLGNNVHDGGVQGTGGRAGRRKCQRRRLCHAIPHHSRKYSSSRSLARYLSHDVSSACNTQPPASSSPSSPADIALSASSRHSLQVLLMRWCGQMLAPPHSLQWQRIALEHSRDALPQASHACGAMFAALPPLPQTPLAD